MKVATEIGSWRYQVAQSRQPADAWYGVAGLVIAVGFPTLFWVTALGLLSKSVGVAVSVAGLVSIGAVIAAICFVGSVVVMTQARQSSSEEATLSRRRPAPQ
jgi:hypothetical protein